MNSRRRVDSEPAPSLGPAFDFLRLVWAVDHALQQKSVEMHRTIGVTGPQRLVIRIVGLLPGMSVGRLAEIIGAHPSTATGLTKRLIRDGLLYTRSDPRDGRRLMLGLTPAGQAVEVGAPGTIEDAIQRLIAATPAADIATAARVLESLCSVLTEGAVPRPTEGSTGPSKRPARARVRR